MMKTATAVKVLGVSALVALFAFWGRPEGLRDFQSLDDLKAWLAQDDTNEWIILKPQGPDGEIVFNDQCEDFALQLQRRAEKAGYRLSFYPMDREEYFQMFGVWLPVGKTHAMNLAIIGNEIYLIEPQTDEVWLYGYLD